MNATTSHIILKMLDAVKELLAQEETGDRYLSPNEAAELLRVSRRTIERHMKDGLLPCSKPTPRCTRIKLSDVEKLANKQAGGNA